MRVLIVCCFGMLITGAGLGAEKTVDDLLKEANDLVKQGKLDQALKAATQAAELDPKSPKILLTRGGIYERLEKHLEAIADFSKVIELDPKSNLAAQAYSGRGGENFKLGKFKESIDDFDRSFELKPNVEEQWKRGIANYYAGRHEAGRKDFEAGEKIWADDVENAAWWYACAVKTIGADKAREQILKIGNDKRIPLMVVYDLYRGKAKPEDVLKAAEEGKPAEAVLNERLFYAHLYLGLWYDAQGDKKKTLEHMTKAAKDFKQKGYMWDVARVHLEVLRNEK